MPILLIPLLPFFLSLLGFFLALLPFFLSLLGFFLALLPFFLALLPFFLALLLLLLLLFLLLLAAIYKYILYPLFISPLRHIPAAYPTALLSAVWIYWIRHQQRENATIRAAHERLGPVVRLGPNEVSVNCIKGGLSKVYAGGMEKGEWYALFESYGIQNMFSMAGSKPHSHRKRMISNAYSKSHINSSAVLSAQTSTILYDRFLPRLHRIHSPQNPAVASPPAGVVDIYELLSAVTMDIVTGYIFGLAAGSNFTADVDSCRHFLDLYSSRRSFNFWRQELPALTAWLAWLGLRLVPGRVDAANREIEDWAMSMCKVAARVRARGGGGREQGGVELVDTPVVYAQLAGALQKGSLKSRTAAATVAAGEKGSSSSSSPAAAAEKGEEEEEEEEEQRLTIASELLDHLAAGFDTSGITLTYLVHEVSQRPALQSALRAELLALSPPLVAASAPALPDPRALDALPLLHAVLWETLRLHPAIPGPQPRVTPADGCDLGPDLSFCVPAGVRVSASAGSLHANEEVYERAGEWRPKRWIDVDGERRKEMDRWFWAFGSGGRMCIGSNLAMYQMKYIVATIYSNYTTTIVDDTGIEQVDAYTAPPKNDKLIIRLERV